MDPVTASDPGSRAAAPLDRIFSARILILAPHMDDETLACGGTMLMHPRKEDVHCIFATDGARSPAPLLPWADGVDPGLARLRQQEARSVAASIGVPSPNLHFLGFPDGRLSSRMTELTAEIEASVDAIRPHYVFAPFRYDVHPDHTALNRAVRSALRAIVAPPTLLEYFVYHRLRFVPGGDVRRAVDGDALWTLDTAAVADAKRQALDRYVTQTTVRYWWQERPVLTEESLSRRCAEPEFFLPAKPDAPLSENLSVHGRTIRFAYLAARYGKPPKDRAKALLRWLLGRDER
jgi:LmbE family N-acetylglucosaminyl deacetylase